MTDRRRFARVALLLALLSAAPAAYAEVGVHWGGGSGKLSLGILKSLVDDPEPVGIEWNRVHFNDPAWFVLNENGLANQDGPPATLIASDMPLVAWARNSAQGYDVVLSRFEDGAWTEPEVLAGDPLLDELDPRLFLNPADDSVHLVYWVDDTTPRVMHREAPADLSAWTAADQLSHPDHAAFRPDGVFHQGQMRVVYELHDMGIGATPRQIMLATLNGTQLTRQMLAITLHEGPNWPRVHSAKGRLWVEWIDWVDGEGGGTMAWLSMTPGSGWSAVQTQPFESLQERDFHVRITIRTLAAQ